MTLLRVKAKMPPKKTKTVPTNKYPWWMRNFGKLYLGGLAAGGLIGVGVAAWEDYRDRNIHHGLLVPLPVFLQQNAQNAHQNELDMMAQPSMAGFDAR